MRSVSPENMQKLLKAHAYPFSKPLTAYLTDAHIAVCCCLGVTHRHVRADPLGGRFADGRLIRTSDILRIELEGEFWVIHTYTGSFYVIASFQPGGYQSLVDYQKFLPQGFYPTPDQLH